MRILTLTAFAILCSHAIASDPPHSLEAKLIKIADGDTITVLFDKTQYKIRLEGIEAPEKGQAYGAKSRRALADRVFGQMVRGDWKKRDRYGRILGRGDPDISLEMDQDGIAWHYKRYSKESALAEAEQ
jgi:endonuclease YncB( thermonuclease family)